MEEKSSNPVLRTKAFNVVHSTDLGGIMTLNGVIGKSLFLILLTTATVIFTWNFIPESVLMNAQAYLIGSAIVGFILALVISFKPSIAPFASPVYAIVEGVFLGFITMFFNAAYPGIALQAVFGTLAVFLAMLGLYKFKIIKVNDRFRTIVFGATAGIAVFYFISIVLGFFNINIPFVFGSGIIGIGFSLVVIVIAALNLAMDFDFIDRQIQRGANKNMEWYAAFGLLVTLIWLYLEILRLLSKLRN